MSLTRAGLYQALAESLSEPPEWMAQPGREWPLAIAAEDLAESSEAARAALVAFSEIPPEPLETRRGRYEALFAGPGRPAFSLYESIQLRGRLLGPESAALDRLYRAAGLEIIGAELPDHASNELAFLAYLAERQASEPELAGRWRKFERRFGSQHAWKWLPEIGHSLASSEDAVYAPIGKLLGGFLDEMIQADPVRPSAANLRGLPLIQEAELCNLCGFCVQVCPSKAMIIRETGDETALLLSGSRCLSCWKCERICETGALSRGTNATENSPDDAWMILRRSPRAICPQCKDATVSQAELDYVAEQIGHPLWLNYCLACRSNFPETIR